VNGELIALYDGQCEVCQAGVSWIELLDSAGRVRCVPLQSGPVTRFSPELDEEACLRDLHVVRDGKVWRGWDAVVEIAGALPVLAWLPTADRSQFVHRAGDAGYRWLAQNRYQLSKCRGGACEVDHVTATRAHAGLGPFWTCYTLGMLASLPLITRAATRDLYRHGREYIATYRKNVDLLDGELSLWFLGGFPSDVVPLAFGERFAAVVYRGVLVDPGSPRMRRSLGRHLDRHRGAVRAVCATHGHEEHIGNLGWAAERSGVDIYLTPEVDEVARRAPRIPRTRAAVIGQPSPLRAPVKRLDGQLVVDGTTLDVIPVPGHSDDHIALHDAERGVLLIGDAFMGTYFSSPNPDVDSRAWIGTLERVLELDIEVMVGGHGHIHTLSDRVPDVPGVVIREDPNDALRAKLDLLRWFRQQVEDGAQEGLTVRAIEATCFPWRRRWSWERSFADELARATTRGEFSRTELVRSFQRSDTAELPTVLEARLAMAR
jgi:glyoxylase-like metal-dependent hydrolase (beta-lactamase superfamily II)/predicted DCC family thiol-disulfide oxidoreductase YuxK